MLTQLQIRNIALIDHVSIELGSGLNILTGETGAGKSIIIDSINAILGDRISRELIRTGAEKASVEAVFQIDNERFGDIFEALGIEPEEDGTLIISRECSVSGKNSCRINGRISTVSMLKELGARLIDIHGQNDNQSLLKVESHIDMLDSFAGEELEKIKKEYMKLLEKYKALKSKLKSLSGDKGERERKIDLLTYQAAEIKKANLKPGEEEKLTKQRMLLSNAERILAALTSAHDLLYSGSNLKGSASDLISSAISELNAISKIDEKYEAMTKKLEELSYLLDDVIDDIRKERDCIEFSPEMLEQLEERLDVIYKLKKKYGSNIDEVLNYCEGIEKELQEILQSEEIIASLKEQISKTEKELYVFAEKMNIQRVQASRMLEERIGRELDDLEMKRAKFKVNIEFENGNDIDQERKYGSKGLDRVEFLISPNAGEPLKPLAKIASGGEMSRIMLAIKTILANVDDIPTLIFDEIDIGISGRAAQKVGEKLSYIAKNHQVLCVTHLAQIACMADSHYMIEKITDMESTATKVCQLDGECRRKEIARILGGANISQITLQHAEEMLAYASDFKKKAN
ncbi:MAG: DNA repair protein RecN [Clostridia bacterium]|nr:DNA repair protein RecN [Clostridia bacterium]